MKHGNRSIRNVARRCGCAVIFYFESSGGYFGKFINIFFPCVQQPMSSFPCYGVYDVALMTVVAVLGVVCILAFLFFDF